MGRHGGGSRSGGSSRSSSSRSSSGSRSGGGGSSIRTSSTPFKGCYNRSYYDRNGTYRSYYTESKEFGLSSGWTAGTIFGIMFITIHMVVMVGAVCFGLFNFQGKVKGPEERIMVIDEADVLTVQEELDLYPILNKVYEESGMPITVYTTVYDWENYYNSIEVYTEELYYGMGLDEDSMIILFVPDRRHSFYDWGYNMYCGDNTIKCLSDKTFDKLISNFHKAMAYQSLYKALDYSLNSIMDELSKTTVNWIMLPAIFILLFVYSIFYIAIIGTARDQEDAYRYFKENPSKLSNEPMVLYSECPACGASNASQGESCLYCGTLLKISDDEVQFVKPN